jgi:DNA-binding MarR family transcriptional regulator
MDLAINDARAEKLLEGIQEARDRLARIEQEIREACRRPSPPCDDETALSTARALFRQRRTRERHLPVALFAEPAWDMLLELFICRLEGRAVQVSAVGLTAGIPPTTVLRWLDVLEREGMIARSAAPTDLRVVHVTLTKEGLGRMSALLAENVASSLEG